MDKENPNFQYAKREIEGIGNKLEINNSTTKMAKKLFVEAQESGVYMASISRFVTACLFASVKMFDEPVTQRAIIEVSHSKLKETTETYHRIIKNLDLAIEPHEPEPYIQEYGEKLGLEQGEIETALEICGKVKSELFGSGVTASAFAAGILYVTALNLDLSIRQKDISRVSDNTEVTIRNRYQDIANKIDLELAGRRGRNSMG